MISTTSSDGTSVVAADEGRGPVILIIHGGSSDESALTKYRLDIDAGKPASIKTSDSPETKLRYI
jgi:hypothetical protein